jgi:hypothetical protein
VIPHQGYSPSTLAKASTSMTVPSNSLGLPYLLDKLPRYEPCQLPSFQLGAAFRELTWLETVGGPSGPKPRFLAVSWSPCGSFGLSRRLRPFAEALGRIPVSWVVGTTTCRSRGRASPSKTHAGSRGPCPRLRGLAALPVWSGLLSWGSKIAPPPVRMPCVHSQVGRSPPFGLEAPASRLVPPLSFHPTPTVFSAQHPAGLLHPATGHGVRHVSGASLRCCPKAARWCGSFPDGACPSKLFPPW